MSAELVRARLNLGAVLKNLEFAGAVDAEAAAITASWNISVQFTILRGPAAWVEYSNGTCRQDTGQHPNPDVRLLFVSPAHLNKMFAGSGMPIPAKGFSRLGFLKNDFPKITDRLEAILKPKTDPMADEALLAANTTLTLCTAAHAVRELAASDPVCAAIAAGTPAGTLQMRVLPDGPAAWVTFGPGGVTSGMGTVDRPDAKMLFRDMRTAHEVLSGKCDGFTAIGRGGVEVWGMLPLVDNASLIMDRVERYLA